MYSPAEDPNIEAYLEDQVDKLGSYDEAWRATEAKFDVRRPTVGDVYTAEAEARQAATTPLAPVTENPKQFNMGNYARLSEDQIDTNLLGITTVRLAMERARNRRNEG